MTSQVGAVTIPLVVILGLVLLVTALRSLSVASEVHVVFLLLAIGASTLNWWSLLYPKDLFRELTVLLVLVPFAFVSDSRARTRAGSRRSTATY
jgi:hypothetical protein